MNSGKSTSTETSSSGPWPGAIPTLKTGLGDAQNLYKSGSAFQPYTGSTVVPFSNQTTAGMRGVMNTAQSAIPSFQRGFDAVGDVARRGLTGDQRQSMGGMAALARRNPTNTEDDYMGIARDPTRPNTDAGLQTLSGIASGRDGINTASLYNRLWNQASGSNADRNLKGYASGSYLDGRNNPAFQKVLQRAQGDAQNAVNMNAAQAGRYGSAVHQGNVSREIGDLTARALSDQYNTEVGNMFGANQMLDQQRLANLGVRGQAAAGRTGVEGQNIANRMGAAQAGAGIDQNAINQQLAALGGATNTQMGNANFRLGALNSRFNAGQTEQQNRMNAVSALPGAFNAMLQPYQSQMGIGGMYEDLAGRTMNDQLRIFQEQRDAPKNAIEWLNAIGSGAGRLGSTGTTRVTEPRPSPFMQGLGGAISAYDMFGGGRRGGLY